MIPLKPAHKGTLALFLAFALALVLFICAGCDIHPLGWAVMFAVLRPPEGIVVGVIIAVVWLIYFLTRRD